MKVKKESLKKFLVLKKEQFFSPVKNQKFSRDENFVKKIWIFLQYSEKFYYLQKFDDKNIKSNTNLSQNR